MTAREVSDFQKWSVLAYRALDDAGRVLMTVEPECSSEDDNLKELQATIRELLVQALVLNDVLTRRQMDRKFQFGRLDTEALIAPKPRLKQAGWLYEYGDDRGDATNDIIWRACTSTTKPRARLFRNIEPLYRIMNLEQT